MGDCMGKTRKRPVNRPITVADVRRELLSMQNARIAQCKAKWYHRLGLAFVVAGGLYLLGHWLQIEPHWHGADIVLAALVDKLIFGMEA